VATGAALFAFAVVFEFVAGGGGGGLKKYDHPNRMAIDNMAAIRKRD
jgi:hypothetical protein